MQYSLLRYVWLILGCVCVVLGFIGVAMPGIDGTVFFLLAAWLFSKSSERFLNWLLRLPIAGQLIQDYRNGLGMPLKAKYMAILSMSIAVWVSIIKYIPEIYGRSTVFILWLVGIWYIWSVVPTRERVLLQRQQQP